MKIGIAGAGITGQLLALSCVNVGWEVTLFDVGKENNCSATAAGLLAPIAELEKSDLVIYQLGIEALKQYWPQILTQLNKPIYFNQSGSIVISHPKDHTELKKFADIVQNKLAIKHHFKKLSQREMIQLEPQLDKFTHGHYLENEGQIDNQNLLLILEKYLQEKHVKWFSNTKVTAVNPGEIIVNDNKYQFDYACDCRGLGAKENFKNLRAIRGELIWIHAPKIYISRPVRFLHPRYQLYLVPRPDHVYLLGSSEIENEDYSHISVRSTLELLTAAYYLHSDFSEARILKTATQCRPTLPNHLPQIKYGNGFIAINGLYRHGILIAPTLIADVMQWLSHGIISQCYQQLWEKYT